MGRKAGVTAAETKAGLLDAAARVFARRGYEGATISEIASEANLSSGSIYAHYKGKAQLFLSVIDKYGRTDIEEWLAQEGPIDIGELLIFIGSNLGNHPAAERTLLLEAIMAAKYDPEVRAALSASFADQLEFIASSIEAAQKAGRVRPDLSPNAAAQFAAAVALGSIALTVLETPKVDDGEWSDMVRTVVQRLEAVEELANAPKSRRRSSRSTGLTKRSRPKVQS